MFDEFVQILRSREPLPPLYPTGAFDKTLSQRIMGDSDADLFGALAKVLSTQQKQLLRAGLLVWNDDIDAAHPIVQEIENPTGSFWHAIIHRREGDAANSNYWWRRTGEHPAFATLLLAVQSTLTADRKSAASDFRETLQREGRWLPMEFVNRCEEARQTGLPDEWQRRVQVAEIQTLLNWCQVNPD